MSWPLVQGVPAFGLKAAGICSRTFMTQFMKWTDAVHEVDRVDRCNIGYTVVIF